MLRISIHILSIFSFLFVQLSDALCQDSLTLDQAIFLAKNKSLLAKRAERDLQQSFWRYRRVKAGFRPEFMLSGTIPNYTQSFQEVIQPDGKISFRPIRYDNSVLSARVTQQLLPTGGSMFIQSDIQRYEDFVNSDIMFNGLPVRVGLQQSLTGYNAAKWNKRIADVSYIESEKSFISDMEQVALETCLYFFDVLSAQTNKTIANSNLQNTEKLYKIAKERLELGKISKEDYLQLKLEWVNSKSALREADQQLQTSSAKLRSFLTFGAIETLIYVQTPLVEDVKTPIQFKEAVDKAYANRPELKMAERFELEAQQALIKAKSERRFQADLQASLGLSRSANELDQVYQDPQEEQNLAISFSIPIVDWGKRKSAVRIAEYEKEYIQAFSLNQSYQLEADVVDAVSNYNKMLFNIQLMEEAQDIALERFDISTERFLMGHISTTEYTLSLRSKDNMQRTYTSAIRDYWYAVYRLRITTLYDFEQNKNIEYSKS